MDDDRLTVSVNKEGLEHVASLDRLSLDDSAVYSAEIDDKDYGTLTSLCQLTVNGMYGLFPFCWLFTLYEIRFYMGTLKM